MVASVQGNSEEEQKSQVANKNQPFMVVVSEDDHQTNHISDSATNVIDTENEPSINEPTAWHREQAQYGRTNDQTAFDNYKKLRRKSSLSNASLAKLSFCMCSSADAFSSGGAWSGWT